MKNPCTVVLEPLCCISQGSTEPTHLGKSVQLESIGWTVHSLAICGGHVSHWLDFLLVRCVAWEFPDTNMGAQAHAWRPCDRAVAVDLLHMEHSCVCP